jgi:hypothetical protein
VETADDGATAVVDSSSVQDDNLSARRGGPVTRCAELHDGEHAGRQARRRAPWLWRARPRPLTSTACRAGTSGSARARPRPCALAYGQRRAGLRGARRSGRTRATQPSELSEGAGGTAFGWG